MTDIEKQIWLNVYSWHMASYQKRVFDTDGEPADMTDLEGRSEDAVTEACEAVRAFRLEKNRWMLPEDKEMVDSLF